jgi:hypothetical protein
LNQYLENTQCDNLNLNKVTGLKNTLSAYLNLKDEKTEKYICSENEKKLVSNFFSICDNNNYTKIAELLTKITINNDKYDHENLLKAIKILSYYPNTETTDERKIYESLAIEKRKEYYQNETKKEFEGTKLSQIYQEVEVPIEVVESLLKTNEINLFNPEVLLEFIDKNRLGKDTNNLTYISEIKDENFVVNFILSILNYNQDIDNILIKESSKNISDIENIVLTEKIRFQKEEQHETYRILGFLNDQNQKTNIYSTALEIHSKFKNNFIYPWLTSEDGGKFPIDNELLGIRNIIGQIKDQCTENKITVEGLDNISNLSNNEVDKNKQFLIEKFNSKIKNRKSQLPLSKYENNICIVLNNDMNTDNLSELSLEELTYLDQIIVLDVSLFYALTQIKIENTDQNKVLKKYLVRNYKALIEAECRTRRFYSFAKNALSLLIGLDNVCLDMGQEIPTIYKDYLDTNPNKVYGIDIKYLADYIHNYLGLYNKHGAHPRFQPNKQNIIYNYKVLYSCIQDFYQLYNNLISEEENLRSDLKINNEQKNKAKLEEILQRKSQLEKDKLFMDEFKRQYISQIKFKNTHPNSSKTSSLYLPLDLIKKIEKSSYISIIDGIRSENKYYQNIGEIPINNCRNIGLSQLELLIFYVIEQIHRHCLYGYEKEDTVYAYTLYNILGNNWSGYEKTANASYFSSLPFIRDIKELLEILKRNNLYKEEILLNKK